MADTESLNVNREEILSEEERVEKKGKWMYPIVIAALIVIFIVIFGYGLRLVTTMEHPYPPVVLEEGRTPVPQNNAELAAHFGIPEGYKPVCAVALGYAKPLPEGMTRLPRPEALTIETNYFKE